MKVAIAFTSKDRTELSKRSIEPLINSGADVWWFDGSNTSQGENLLADYPATKKFANVKGGPEIANIMALTLMLEAGYDYLGICESDVLLPDNWLEPTLNLFNIGDDVGLPVGAVSPRAYEDRVLFQCDDYAVMHNLGAGCVIFSREAARRVLQYHRTPWTLENRTVFAHLAGIDIGRYWAFRASENFLTADWGWDKALASTGLCSLALTPSPVQMIGQIPSLEEQGLKLVDTPVEGLCDAVRLETFKRRLGSLYQRDTALEAASILLRDPSGGVTVFAHQIPFLGGTFEGEWRHQWSQAFGPHAWRAEETSVVRIPAFGAVEILATGGKQGAVVRVCDTESGFEMAPQLPPEDGQRIPQLLIPGAFSQREVEVTCEPGAVFYGLRSVWPQAFDLTYQFNFHVLPSV